VTLELRARAATAALELLFGFNPHQRRGPDGRFIKMPDSELKRPRRPRRPKAAPRGSDKVYRQRRELYNDGLIRDAREQRDGFGNPDMYPELERLEAMKPGPARDLVADELAEKLNDRIPDPNDRYQPPHAGGPKMVQRPVEDRLYRARREQYNEDVISHVSGNRSIYKDEADHPEMYGAYDQALTMEPGPERDAVLDRMVELLNAHPSTTHPYTPPTTTAPGAAERGADVARPPITAPYEQRRDALRRSVEGGAVDEQLFSQGAMGETRRFDLADGSSTVYKRQTRDWDRGGHYPVWSKMEQTDAEELAAITAAALGVRAPAIARTGDEEIYMELMPGEIGEARWPYRSSPPKGVVIGQQGVRMGLLDTLIENTDRHGGNYLVDQDDNLYAIDHGLAFSKTYGREPDGRVVRRPVGPINATGDFALENFVSPSGNLYDNPLTRADGERLKQVMADLRQEFVDRGRLGWWESMNERALHVAARASGYEDMLE
jgi:hypothetical protein